MRDKIIARRIVKGEIVSEVELSRDNLQQLMDTIKDIYYDDNSVSSALSQYLPDIKKITVNETRNADKENPSIFCTLSDGKNVEIIVRRRHTIMWAIINKWFC